MYGLTLGTYDCTDLGSPEEWNDRSTGGNLEDFFLGDLLEFLDVIELAIDVGNKLGFYDGRVVVTILVALYQLSRGT